LSDAVIANEKVAPRGLGPLV